MKKDHGAIYVQVESRLDFKLILKREIQAMNYFSCREKRGVHIWDILKSIQNTLYEPIGIWLPPNLRQPDTLNMHKVWKCQ